MQKLNIAILSYRSAEFGGGQGVYVKDISKALQSAGHNVEVISGPPYPNLDNGIKLIKLPGLNLFETFSFKDRLKKIHKKRSKSLSDPKESVNNLISNNIDVIKNEYVIQTHVTNPLIKSDTIQKALNQFKTDGIPLFSVNEYYSRFYNKDKTEINHSIETLIPTQELDPIYEENSNFYIFSKENFKDMNNRISKRSNYFVMNKNESIDIDEYEDLEIVKKYLLGL